MKPEIEDTDIIIRRAANGWIVFTGSEYEADYFMTTVYEDGDAWGEQEALIHLFREHFSGYTQSKKQGGIKLEVREKGYAFEEDEEDEHESNVIANTSEQIEWLEKVAGKKKEVMDKTMTKDAASEQNNNHYVTKVQEASGGELFIELPRELMEQLGWKAGDDVEWGETEICEDWGEHKGLILSNKTKLFRDGLE